MFPVSRLFTTPRHVKSTFFSSYPLKPSSYQYYNTQKPFKSDIVFFKQANCLSFIRYYSKHEDRDRIPVPVIPRDKLTFHFTASSGPGGQNVNHVNTKVELRFKPSEAMWIPQEMRARFIEQNLNRINKDGEMIITSQRERKQSLNLEDCVSKLKQYLNQASWIPKERIATEVPEHENEKRLDEKRARSSIKKARTKNWDF